MELWFSNFGVGDLKSVMHLQEYVHILFHRLLLSCPQLPFSTVSLQAQLEVQLVAMPSHTCKSQVTWIFRSVQCHAV